MNIFQVEKIWVNKLRHFEEETEPRIFPMLADTRLINKIILSFHRNERTRNSFPARLHNSTEAVLRLNYFSEKGVSVIGLQSLILKLIKNHTICAILKQEHPNLGRGKRIAKAVVKKTLWGYIYRSNSD